MSWSCALLLLVSQTQGPQGIQGPQGVPREGAAPTPGFLVHNRADTPRTEIVRVSMPFPRGAHRELFHARVADRSAAMVPLLRWADGSIQVAQLQVQLEIGAGERLRIPVRTCAEPFPEPDAGVPWHYESLFQGGAVGLPLFTEVLDPWKREYRARLVVDASAGPGGLVRATPLVRVRRLVGVHRAVGDTKAEFLGVSALLTTFRGERRGELTLLLDNGAHRTGPVLGPVRFQGFALVTESDGLRLRPRFIQESGLKPPLPRAQGGYRQVLLGPSDQVYLGDRTARCFRFDLFLDDGTATKAEKVAGELAVTAPLRPLPDLDWTRHTRAFGVHGGPAPAPAAAHGSTGRPGKADAQAALAVYRWRLGADVGPFGAFGDPKAPAAQGTPRNGPCALHNVLRWRSADLLEIAEGVVMQHCLRPPPGVAPRLPEAMAPFRAGLSDRTIAMPHGFGANDYEHFSVDLLFDYFWLTGDPLAAMEIRRTVAGLPRLLEGLPFLTCRGEGWCMQAAALHEMATGDAAVLAGVQRRFRALVQKRIGAVGTGWVLRQPPHKDAFGDGVFFDAPWQMAAFVHGLHAVYMRTGDAVFRDVAIRTARVMAGSGWVEGTGPKYLVSATGPGRYSMPVGYGPLEGTAIMQTGAFVLAERMATEVADKQLFRRRADFIYGPYHKAEPRVSSANPWFQLLLDRRDPGL